MRYWLYLTGAIVLEVAGTTSMKLSKGLTKPLPSTLLFVFYAASLVSLTLALRKIDIGVAYAVWSGVGTALIATIGVLVFREPMTAVRILSIALIIAGVCGLNLTGTD